MVLTILQPSALADTPGASPEQVRWFAGDWRVGPADVEGLETISGGGTCSDAAEIRITGQGKLQRTVRRKNGAKTTVEFEVKYFGGNFPWWPVDGHSAVVARKIDANSFVLASTNPVGRADWNNGLKHTRCPG
jgi:hypothetical protein